MVELKRAGILGKAATATGAAELLDEHALHAPAASDDRLGVAAPTPQVARAAGFDERGPPVADALTDDRRRLAGPAHVPGRLRPEVVFREPVADRRGAELELGRDLADRAAVLHEFLEARAWHAAAGRVLGGVVGREAVLVDPVGDRGRAAAGLAGDRLDRAPLRET
ncbi:MAG TPA: hypothetical protein VI006_01495 [Solirubrobacteraceae bacterium]